MNMIFRHPLILILAAGCLAMGCSQSRPEEQDAAIEAVKKLGGKVGIDSQSAGQPVEGVDFSKTQVGDQELASLELFVGLRWLFLDDTPVTDAALGGLERFRQLQSLSLNGTRVTDAGMTKLQSLPALRRLNLGRTAVTDAGLESLGQLAGLKVLDLTGGTQISAAATARLKERMPKLVVLR